MSKVVVVGAGPIGLYTAIERARSGDDVVLVDRDPGPSGDGWERRGVMQFRHPHFFRHIVRQTLLERAPDVWEALVAAGGVPALPPGMPEPLTGLACRRSTFEMVLRSAATSEPHVSLRVGHVERVVVERGRAVGVVVDGVRLDADLVVVASGRAGRLGDEHRPPAEGGPCGFSYVSRMYRARIDEAHVEVDAAGLPISALHDGYLVIVFPQDAGTISTLIVRPSDDEALAQLRHRECFEVAARTVPLLSRWTDPDRFAPFTDVLPGGGLTNTYRGQARDVRGLVFVGDAVSTTNPAAGRGISLGLRQVRALGDLIADGADDLAAQFEAWCDENIRPWYEDHVYWDATLLRRFRGADLDLDARIPSDVICAAAEVDPEILPAARAYLGMLTGPAVLRPVEERARAVLRTGWRPRLADGPTGAELAAAIAAPLSALR
jgi:2-polyprenyl-6-methoxyphenol hydroxylase-like FAD-dependent oxidoreductase